MKRTTMFTFIGVLVLAVGAYFHFTGEAAMGQAPPEEEEIEIPFEIFPQGM